MACHVASQRRPKGLGVGPTLLTKGCGLGVQPHWAVGVGDTVWATAGGAEGGGDCAVPGIVTLLGARPTDDGGGAGGGLVAKVLTPQTTGRKAEVGADRYTVPPQRDVGGGGRGTPPHPRRSGGLPCSSELGHLGDGGPKEHSNLLRRQVLQLRVGDDARWEGGEVGEEVDAYGVDGCGGREVSLQPVVVEADADGTICPSVNLGHIGDALGIKKAFQNQEVQFAWVSRVLRRDDECPHPRQEGRGRAVAVSHERVRPLWSTGSTPMTHAKKE